MVQSMNQCSFFAHGYVIISATFVKKIILYPLNLAVVAALVVDFLKKKLIKRPMIKLENI